MTSPQTPPAHRTPLGLAMTIAIQSNSLHLQCCEHCATVQYPPREVCRNCLGDNLRWSAIAPQGVVMASSALHHCLALWFVQRRPWLMGSVQMGCGPLVLAHLLPDCAAAGSPVRVLALKDVSDQAVLVAVPLSLSPDRAETMAHQLLFSDSEETT